jgi:GTP-binding protein EngB required for normal cell division
MNKSLLPIVSHFKSTTTMTKTEGNFDVLTATELMSWYADSVRPFFENSLEEDKLNGFDKDYVHLKRTASLPGTELAVCFLGNSGVGKSTLVNSVIGGDRAVVPSGGVGPLTA